MYWPLSHRNVLPLNPTSVSSNSAAICVSQLTGVVERLNVGRAPAWTTVPSAFFNWNFVGMVLPSLKKLSKPPWWAVSLIGCRNPSQRYRTPTVFVLLAAVKFELPAKPARTVYVPTPDGAPASGVPDVPVPL